MENTKLKGADEYLESMEGEILLQEKIEERIQAYKKAVLKELTGTGLSKID